MINFFQKHKNNVPIFHIIFSIDLIISIFTHKKRWKNQIKILPGHFFFSFLVFFFNFFYPFDIMLKYMFLLFQSNS